MFKITKEHEQIIKQVAKIAASKSSMQSLENILVKAHDKLSLTSGDGSIEITSIIDCEIGQECEFTVNANRFLSTLNACGFECDVIMKQDAIQVKSGRKRFKLSTLDADVYPEYPELKDGKKITSNSLDLIGLLHSGVIAASSGDSRVMLNGVYVGDDVVATDGHRMIKFSEGYDCSVIVPSEVIKKIPMIDGVVTVSSSIIEIADNNTVVKSKLVDSKFVNYQRAIADADSTITINAEDLIDAVKSAMITDSSGAVSIDVEDSAIIQSKGSKADESSITVECEGDGVKFSANGKYILDALSFYTGTINIGFNDRQMIINDGYITNVVMAVVK